MNQFIWTIIVDIVIKWEKKRRFSWGNCNLSTVKTIQDYFYSYCSILLQITNADARLLHLVMLHLHYERISECLAIMINVEEWDEY